MISVSMDLGNNELQVLGFLEVSGPELYDVIGSEYGNYWNKLS
jgi:hypothetical protein